MELGNADFTISLWLKTTNSGVAILGRSNTNGVLDQSSLPSDLDLMIGRVDLYNMPAFGLDEPTLLCQYIEPVPMGREPIISI